jgi:predicted Zn-dependent peptidase
MEVIFRSEAKKDVIQKRTFLSDILTDCSKKYQTSRDLLIKMEELYKPSIYGTTSKTGNVLNTIFVLDFINPKYIDEDNYLDSVLSFFFSLILEPNVINGEFALNNFTIVKERLITDIKSINDSPLKKSVRTALDKAVPGKPASFSLLGTLEMLDDLTPTDLYNEYLNMLNHDLCDIFVIGDISAHQIETEVKKQFSIKTIKNHKLDYFVYNTHRNKTLEIADNSSFIQSSLVMVYDIKELNDREKNIIFPLFNYLFGNGGMSCKLYQEVREKTSLCYAITSMYLKYDRLLLIQVSLDNDNVSKAIKLIKKCLKAMQGGDFTDKELSEAKTTIINSLKMSLDNQVSILNNYVFTIFNNSPDAEQKIKELRTVTAEEIIKISKMLHINTVYNLSGDKNGKD